MSASSGRRRRARWALAGLVALPLAALAVSAGVAEWRRLAAVVDEKFAGRRWDFPSRIYSDEFLIHIGQDVAAAGVPRRLERLDYRPVEGVPSVGGEAHRTDGALEIALRPGAMGRTSTERVRISLERGVVVSIVDLDSGENLAAVALEPEEITGIYAGQWEQRRAIKVVDVAPILVRAILVTEDSRFFQHHGVDAVGIGRAALANLRSRSVRQGGSTLTQQLMKNFFLTSDRTVSRKLRELAMALVAEQRYSKMQILENYLNEIYLGQRGARGIFGVAQASHFYFGKDVRDLTLPEAALIAGLIRAPNAYSPFQSPGRARERRDTVLRLLFEAGEIDADQLAAARSSPLGVIAPQAEANDASFFIDLVKAELAGRYPPELLTTEGLQIYTTLDPLLQEQATRAVAEGLGRLETTYAKVRRTEEHDRLEAALVALHPHTGEIKALVGGRSYQASQFNRAIQARRQPGSAFKPIVYLAGLLATGPAHLTPVTILEDEPFTWTYADGREWTPENDGGRYLGSVTARTALEQSLNAATARVAQGVGLTPIVALAHNLGIESPLPAVPSLVLGAAEVSPLELASAYAVFASGGTRAEPVAIRRVESRDGQPIAGESPAMSSAISPEDAFLLTHMLEGVLERGTAKGARAAGFQRPAAGKTGTTNDYRDAWFVGYTPDLVAGVWVGFDEHSPLGLTGARGALPLWTDFMKQATAALPPRAFSPPPGITLVAVDRASGVPVDEHGDGDSRDVIEEAFRDLDAPRLARPAGPPDEPGAQEPDAAPRPSDEAPAGEPEAEAARVAVRASVGEENSEGR